MNKIKKYRKKQNLFFFKLLKKNKELKKKKKKKKKNVWTSKKSVIKARGEHKEIEHNVTRKNEL